MYEPARHHPPATRTRQLPHHPDPSVTPVPRAAPSPAEDPPSLALIYPQTDHTQSPSPVHLPISPRGGAMHSMQPAPSKPPPKAYLLHADATTRVQEVLQIASAFGLAEFRLQGVTEESAGERGSHRTRSHEQRLQGRRRTLRGSGKYRIIRETGRQRASPMAHTKCHTGSFRTKCSLQLVCS